MLKKTILLLLIISTFLTAETGYPGFDFEHEHHEFKVFANGKEMPVAHVAQFAFSSLTLDEPLSIRIETAHDLRWVDIRPKNEAIDFDYSENKIEFELTEPKKLSIELNGENSYPLYLFANEPQNYTRDENTIVFEGGKVHRPGKIEIQSGQTVLLEKGAVVRGYIDAENLENIKIVGEGIFDGSEFSKENRLLKHRIIQLSHCKNVLIDGIMIVNSATWTIEPMFCENVEIRDIKMLNWRFGSDGIDLVGCKDITIDNSFIRANDDCVVLKTWGGREKYPQEPTDGPNVSNINVINSIFWNMAWGNALEIGFELRAQKIENVRFENCDIIAVDRGAVFSIHNGDYCTVQDITYKDIRVENANHKLIDLAIFVSQYSVDHQGKKSERAKYYLHGAWDGVQKVMPGNEKEIAKGRGHIKNITFENIAILDGKLPFSVIAGFDNSHQVENVKIKNLSFYEKYQDKITRGEDMQVTRRDFLKVMGSASALTFMGCGLGKKVQKKPNILFIMSDDHAYQAISAYDDKLIQTPNIDRLAKEGMKFTNGCVTNSICAPARATILTGKHCHIHGKIDNRFPFDESQTTFPQIMQQNGYQTAMYGKLHFGNNPKGVDDFMILPGQGNYINPDFITKEGKVHKEGYCTDIITDLTIEWLDKKRDPDKPFMMMYLHKAPHRPWWPRPDKMAEFVKKKFPEPKTLFDDYENRGTAAKTAEMNLLKHMKYGHDSKIYPEVQKEMGTALKPYVPPAMWGGIDGFSGPYNRATEEQKADYKPTLDKINKDFKENWPSMTDEEKMRWKYQRYMQDYLACISSVDDNVGRVLDYLDESGLADNTIVIYTSDQGFYLGEHGWFDKRFIYDESFKTPLLIKWPEKVKPGSVSDEMVQNLDFAQTMLDAAGIESPDDMQGESLLPLLEGKTDKWKRDAVYYHYYEYPAVHMVKRHYGIVTTDYKLAHFYYDVDEWELYDRKKDTYEINNVYDDPAYADVVKALKVKLKALRKKYGDSRELDQKYLKQYLEKIDA